MKNRISDSSYRYEEKSAFYWSKRAFVLSVLLSLVLLLLTVLIFSLWEQRNISVAEEYAQLELNNLRKNFYLLLGNQQMFASLIARLIEERLETEQDFTLSSLDTLFAFLSEHHPSFITATIAREDVVVDQYPYSDLHGIGFHLSDLPLYHKHVKGLSSHEGVVLDGPIYLEDGSACLVSRVAVLDATGAFELLLSLHFDLQVFLIEAGIKDLSSQYRYFFEFSHLGGNEVFFWGYEDIHALNPVVLPVSFSLLSWNMYIAPQKRWNTDSLPLIIYAVLGIIISIALGIHTYFRQIRFQHLKVSSGTDSLTGLFNKREIMSHVHQMIKNEKAFALTLIDIDNFKILNDTYGHVNGDKALLALVEKMRSSLTTFDLIGRFGGDEFIILLPQCTESESILHLYRSIKNTTMQLNEAQVTIELSMGVALYPAEGNNCEELLQVADRRLYFAKVQGKGRICLQG